MVLRLNRSTNTELSPSGTTSVEFILNDDLDNNQSEYVFVELEKDGSPYAAPDEFGAKVTARWVS
jgi:hypothetical protein